MVVAQRHHNLLAFMRQKPVTAAACLFSLAFASHFHNGSNNRNVDNIVNIPQDIVWGRPTKVTKLFSYQTIFYDELMNSLILHIFLLRYHNKMTLAACCSFNNNQHRNKDKQDDSDLQVLHDEM